MKNKYLFGFIFGLLAIGALIYAIKSGSFVGSREESGRLKVTASFYPLYFFSKFIGGDKVDVSNITPAGAEPHDYEPTPADIARIEDSKMLILNGGRLEAWGDKVRDILKGSQTSIVVAGERLADEQAENDGNATQDPHVWLSPPLAKQQAERILAGFISVDSANKSYYEANALLLQKKLADLDQAYREGLSQCADKDIITSHAAFGHLATAYHLKQIPIAGLSPDTEPSAQDLVHVAEFAKANNVKYIFFESLVSPKLSQTIANEIGAQTLVLNPIEGLTDEELAEGKDYFTEMRANLTNLQIALGCKN